MFHTFHLSISAKSGHVGHIFIEAENFEDALLRSREMAIIPYGDYQVLAFLINPDLINPDAYERLINMPQGILLTNQHLEDNGIKTSSVSVPEDYDKDFFQVPK